MIPTERFTFTLFGLLTEAFESVYGIFLDRGTSLFETLADITAEEASRATSGRCATSPAPTTTTPATTPPAPQSASRETH